MNPLARPVPALDPAPIPGPWWLFHLLWIVTFAVHLLAMNAALGGAFVGALAALRGDRASARRLAAANSWTVSATITFGIAPLLFLQVIDGHFFYSATIVLAPVWFSLLGLLTVGYYANHLAKAQLARGGTGAGPLVVETILFLGIAGIQVAVALTMLRPDRWEAITVDRLAVLADPAWLPRWLHFVLAAVTLGGLLLAMRIVADRGDTDADARSRAARWGAKIALVATALQFPVGFWLLLGTWRPALGEFMRGGVAAMGLLALGTMLGVGLVVMLALLGDPVQRPAALRGSVAAFVVVLLAMVVTRHQLREAHLAAWRAQALPVSESQWGVFAIFVVALVVCLALTVAALRKAATDRPSEGEPTA